jgi:hypothetical protein
MNEEVKKVVKRPIGRKGRKLNSTALNLTVIGSV